MKRTAEHSAKISKALTGRKISAEAKLNMSLAKMGRARKPFTAEHRANMRQAQQRRWDQKQAREAV